MKGVQIEPPEKTNLEMPSPFRVKIKSNKYRESDLNGIIRKFKDLKSKVVIDKKIKPVT